MSANTTFTSADGDGYELNMGRWSRRLVIPFIEFVGIAENECVLDVGCGTGSFATEVCKLRRQVEVHAIDMAKVYTSYARQRDPDSRLHFAVGDACLLPYPDNQFNCVAALLVLHFVPVPVKAIGEMRRVAKPRATVAAAVWDARGGFVANRLFFDTAAALDPRASQRRAKNYTRPLTKPGELITAWHNAGFVDVAAKQFCIRMEFENFHDYWSPYLGKDGPGAEYVSSLTRDEQARLETAVRAAYLDGDTDGPRSYAALAWAVKGVVPDHPS